MKFVTRVQRDSLLKEGKKTYKSVPRRSVSLKLVTVKCGYSSLSIVNYQDYKGLR